MHFLRILYVVVVQNCQMANFPQDIVYDRRRCESSTASGGPLLEIFKICFSEIAFPTFSEHIKKTSASQNNVLMVKFVINCMLNIQTQHKSNYFLSVRMKQSVWLRSLSERALWHPARCETQLPAACEMHACPLALVFAAKTKE